MKDSSQRFIVGTISDLAIRLKETLLSTSIRERRRFPKRYCTRECFDLQTCQLLVHGNKRGRRANSNIFNTSNEKQQYEVIPKYIQQHPEVK